ncbi:MAG TPA: hypothetical protein VFF80_00085 [Bacillota bacterium]|nr:hypothetical protein [Bacillota bacterium]
MKKDLSVLMLLVRNSFWRVLGVILIMLTLESFFFFADPNLVHVYTISLDELLKGKIIGLGFLLGLVMLTVVLVSFGSDKKSKEAYTLRRLQISERRVWFLQVIYHTGCFLVLYIAEAWLIVSLYRYYLIHSTVQPWSELTLWLAIKQNPFSHSLLPLQNTLGWLRNLTLILGFGVTSASEPIANRSGQSAFVVYPLQLLAILAFMFNINTWQIDLLITVVAILLAGYAVYCVWKGEEKHDP